MYLYINMCVCVFVERRMHLQFPLHLFGADAKTVAAAATDAVAIIFSFYNLFFLCSFSSSSPSIFLKTNMNAIAHSLQFCGLQFPRRYFHHNFKTLIDTNVLLHTYYLEYKILELRKEEQRGHERNEKE